jgi:phospholipase/carboxylesterase
MTKLTGPERPAASGTADSLVILLHGYGADGGDLIGLADPLAPHLPKTRFVAPNAPQPCVNNPAGFQWFPIPWLDGSSEAESLVAAGQAAAALNAYLDAAATTTPPDRTVLVGFSQGTMMALQVAPRRPVPVAGIVGFSGRLLRPERLAAEIASRPPVLLVHGDQDPMVPIAHLKEAADALTAAGVETRTHVSPGVGHGIAPDGLGLALGFIRQHLGTPE